MVNNRVPSYMRLRIFCISFIPSLKAQRRWYYRHLFQEIFYLWFILISTFVALQFSLLGLWNTKIWQLQTVLLNNFQWRLMSFFHFLRNKFVSALILIWTMMIKRVSLLYALQIFFVFLSYSFCRFREVVILSWCYSWFILISTVVILQKKLYNYRIHSNFQLKLIISGFFRNKCIPVCNCYNLNDGE